LKLENLVQDLSPTTKLYLRDHYLTEFSADVVRVEYEGKNKIYLVLDSTLFHPKSGGQPSDTGIVRDSTSETCIDKVMSFHNVIIHWGTVKGEIGRKVSGRIDWEKRYLYMRRHTAGHLLDHCLGRFSKVPVETSESWLGDDCYVAYRGLAPSLQIVSEAIALENKMIDQGGEVFIEEYSREELVKKAPNAPNLFRLPPLDRYRVVTIEGCESIPCGGTHTRNIREIVGVKLISVEQKGESFRIYYDVQTL
jgi:alanyl-tRNA synthetase